MTHLRVNQSGWAHHLFAKYPASPLQFPGTWGGRNKNSFGRKFSHSSNLVGDYQDKTARNPYFDRVDLRAKSPLYIAPSCGTVTWLSSMIKSAFSGKYSNKVGRFAWTTSREVARIVFNAGTDTGRLNHFDIKPRTLLNLLCLKKLIIGR